MKDGTRLMMPDGESGRSEESARTSELFVHIRPSAIILVINNWPLLSLFKMRYWNDKIYIKDIQEQLREMDIKIYNPSHDYWHTVILVLKPVLIFWDYPYH